MIARETDVSWCFVDVQQGDRDRLLNRERRLAVVCALDADPKAGLNFIVQICVWGDFDDGVVFLGDIAVNENEVLGAVDEAALGGLSHIFVDYG